MKELKIHNDQNGHPVDLHIDGQTLSISAYMVLAAVPREDRPGVQCLTYGNSELVGRMIMTYYERCAVEQPEMAHVLEEVAKGILGLAEAARKNWPGEGTGPEVIQ